MSFQSYDTFQGQQGGEDTGTPGGAGVQQQQGMGQPIESTAGQYQGGNMGGAPGGPQGSDSKTTLWYVIYLGLRHHLGLCSVSFGEDTVSRCHVEDTSLTSSDRMGELEPWIDENFVRSVWFGMGEQVNVKMIRDKFSGSVMAFRLWGHLI